MSLRGNLFLFLASLLILLIVAGFQSAPGYMDAEYYFIGGQRLAIGDGFSEPFLWNYLDDPAEIPRPSHAYWMPLASILSFISLRLGASLDFSTGRAGFILVAACVPPLAAQLASHFSPRRDAAWLAGLLALFPGFYLAYLPTSDTFGIVMVLGGVWLLIVAKRIDTLPRSLSYKTSFILGLISGLMHLARPDGVIWLGLSLLAGSVLPRMEIHRRWISFLWWFIACLLGYALVMAPWLIRNQVLLGNPLSVAGGKALWFIGYNDLYIYPPSLITPGRWLGSGLGSILNARLWAIGQNLVSTFVVQGEIFLAPLMLLGLWCLRSRRSIWLGTAAWGVVLALMSLVFPFAGARGGFFHSASALQPMLWAAVPAGLDAFIDFGTRRRGWDAVQARRFFQTSLVILAVLFSGLALQRRVIGADWKTPIWDQPSHQQAANARLLAQANAGPGDVVMVNNPPGFYLASGSPAVAIPDGDVRTLLAAGRRYNARYVILEANHPPGLNALYNHPQSYPGLRYLGSDRDVHLFAITPESGSGDGY